jgi:hypothetical protein
MSEASYRLRSSALLIPPRSTTRSKPTLERTLERILAIVLATIQPMTKMIRNTTSLGTKVAMFAQVRERPAP